MQQGMLLLTPDAGTHTPQAPTLPANDGAFGPLTMSSREIAELTGKDHAHVMRDIRKLLAELGEPEEGYVQLWRHPQNGQDYPEFRLDRELTETLLTGYSAILRRKVIARWHVLEGAAAPRAMTQIEVLLQSVQLLANVERQQREHAAAIVRVEARMEEIGTSQLLKECPSNAEPITRIRIRMAQRHGLSSRVVDHVMRQHPSAPKPAGMVRNEKEEAMGATYAVYWVKDVTAVFDQFVKASAPVPGTAAQFTNVFMDGRFTMRSRA